MAEQSDKSSGERRGAGEGTGTSTAATFAGAGFQFAAAIIVFAFLGQWLDKRFGTDPWLLLLGVVLGASGGFYSMYRKLMSAEKSQDEGRRK